MYYQYQVSFTTAIKRAFSNYCTFTGRASRSEFWWFVLFVNIVSCLLSIPYLTTTASLIRTACSTTEYIEVLHSPGFFSYINGLWNLVILFPMLGLLFRRLHDSGRSGWNWLWTLIPVVGWIVVLVFLCEQSQPGTNEYGPMPNLE